MSDKFCMTIGYPSADKHMIQAPKMIFHSKKQTGKSLIERLPFCTEHGMFAIFLEVGLRSLWKQILAWMILTAYWFNSAG